MTKTRTMTAAEAVSLKDTLKFGLASEILGGGSEFCGRNSETENKL